MYLEPGGLVERAKPGTILIDLSSVLPSTPRKIEPKAKARGVHFLEAPVSGGVTGARAATLALMVGGKPSPWPGPSPCCTPWARMSSTWGPSARGIS